MSHGVSPEFHQYIDCLQLNGCNGKTLPESRLKAVAAQKAACFLFFVTLRRLKWVKQSRRDVQAGKSTGQW